MTYSLIIVVVWILWCYCFINSCMSLFPLKICILRYTWLYSNTIKNCNYHCIFHFGYNSSGESRLVGPEIIQITSEKIRLIRERIQTAQSCQKKLCRSSKTGLALWEVMYSWRLARGRELRDLGIRLSWAHDTLAHLRYSSV